MFGPPWYIGLVYIARDNYRSGNEIADVNSCSWRTVDRGNHSINDHSTNESRDANFRFSSTL